MSSVRSLRQLHKIEYKKINDGEDQTLRGPDKNPLKSWMMLELAPLMKTLEAPPVQVQGHLNLCEDKF